MQHGAAKVFAVDVGYGQLAWSLRQDPRVVNLERRNIRSLTPDELIPTPSLAVIDASFISLTLVIPHVIGLIAARGEIVTLVKPQFEVGKGRVGKGGVVRDPALHAEVLADLQAHADGWQLEVKGMTESPLRGPKGNKEFLPVRTETMRIRKFFASSSAGRAVGAIHELPLHWSGGSRGGHQPVKGPSQERICEGIYAAPLPRRKSGNRTEPVLSLF